MNVPFDTTTAGDETFCLTVSRDNWQRNFLFDIISTYDRCDKSGDDVGRLTAKIWLLGNLRRRAHAMRTLKVAASARISDALHEVHEVSHILLEPLEQ